MKSSSSVAALKFLLLLLAIAQLILSVILYYKLEFLSATLFEPPFRLLSVIAIQALVFHYTDSVTKCSARQKLLRFVALLVVLGVALHFLYQSYVSGKNVDVRGIRVRLEGGIVAVILIGFSILNLISFLRLASLPTTSSNLERIKEKQPSKPSNDAP